MSVRGTFEKTVLEVPASGTQLRGALGVYRVQRLEFQCTTTNDWPGLMSDIDKGARDVSRALFVCYPQLNGVAKAVEDLKQTFN